MAEVRKKVLDDKYNTSKIKTPNVKKQNNKKKNEEKENIGKNSNKKENLYTKLLIFLNGVKGEFQKVHWPSKENMVKYSFATIFFIVFFSLFFLLIEVIFALISQLF